MRIPFAEIANRITGVSTPVFGVSWNPPTLEREVARRLLTFLEDRRALYAPYDQEEVVFSVQSILEIRKRLTDELEQLDRTTQLAQSIADMRTACRKFLDEVQGIDARDIAFRRFHGWGREEVSFFLALGELRGVFGIHIAQVCVRYGIDIERQLASILPAAPDTTP